MSSPSRLRWILLSSLLACLSVRATAQRNGPNDGFERQRTSEDVRSTSDPSQRYAVYLPSSYQRDSTAPVMLLMDPRGRATVPLTLFRDAAEEYGFVLISSYNTLSDADSAFAVNARALSAMLIDARTRFKANPKRFYLVGFSGTAHYAWTVAPQLDGRLAGILGVGGGLPAYSEPIQRALRVIYPFAFFGTAGLADFNFDGVRLLDLALDTTRFPHRFMGHDGEHAWPPASIAAAAVEWFHLQSMTSGLSPRDDAFIERASERHMQEAAELEASGHEADAYRRYREITQDFGPLGGAPEAQERFETLGRDRKVEREMDRRADYARKVIEYKLKVREFYMDYRDANKLPTTESAIRKLKIDKLHEQAASEDIELAGAARRMLATAFVNTAFYEPRDYIRNGDYQRAAGILRIADVIRPGVPRVCYQLARAASQLGEIEEALQSLDCGLKAEWATRELLEADKLLDPLREDPRYHVLIESATSGRAADGDTNL